MIILIGDEFSKFAIEQISRAKKTIKIIVFDWRVQLSTNSDLNTFNNELYAAATRGVDVKAIVSNDSLVAFLNRNRIKAKKVKTTKLLHAKLMIFDDETAIIGSHNFTMSGFSDNVEVSAFVELGPEAPKLLEFFHNLYGV